MILKIDIEMENDAFVLDPRFEVERILKEQVMDQVFDEHTVVILRDINGNTVGHAYTQNQ